jgi:TonB-dependent receptor
LTVWRGTVRVRALLFSHTMTSRQFLRVLLPLLCACVAFVAARAGTISGRITDGYTKLALGGARVTAGGAETYSESTGEFTLANVPAGAQLVEVNYVGYAPMQVSVDVAAEGVTRLDPVFNRDVVRLQQFVITGSAVGTARALNRQRAAETLTNIVAADEIGRFPDQNAAESLQRVPGVSLYRDQGEGRFVDLRGLNYLYTSVTLNGAKLASPEVGGRFLALDVVPADSLAALEVTKVPTPDMDGEGLGGVVNIQTKSAFDANGPTATASAQGIYSKLVDELGSKFNFSASNLFAGGKAGFAVAGTWQQRKFGSRNFEIDDGWTLANSPTSGQFFFLQDIAFRDYEIERTRYGASAALEFRPDSATMLAFKANYNRFTDEEDRNVSFIPFYRGTVAQLDASSATINNVARTRRDLRNREKDQELTAFSLEGSKQVGAWMLDGRAAWSRGHEEKPSEIVARFRHNSGNTGYTYSFGDTYDVRVTKVAGPSDVTDPAFYERLDRVSEASELGDEKEFNIALNARYDLDAGTASFVKFGGSLRDKRKESGVEYYEYSAGPASFTFASLAEGASDYPYFPGVPRINSAAFRQAFIGNRSAFTGGRVVADSTLEDFVTDEQILAGYAMGGTTLGGFQLTAGVRVERTKFDTRGFQVTDDATIAPTSAGRTYTNTLPGIFLRRDLGRHLVLRASVSTSIMRPEFSESSAFRNVNTDDEELEAGNPALETLESRNFDASLEYYLPSLGVVSAAVFYKQVDNFSYAITIPNGDAAFAGYDLITFRNGSDGKIKGLELAYQQQLRFLPAPFDGFGFMTNATLADSSATYPTRPGEKLPFIGQSDLTGNVALTFEKGPLFARVALNWRDAHLREDEPIGGNAVEDRWIDDHHQLDASISYRLTKNFELFVEATNLTNEPFRVYQTGGGSPTKRLVQFEEYDWTANFGVRWKL